METVITTLEELVQHYVNDLETKVLGAMLNTSDQTIGFKQGIDQYIAALGTTVSVHP